MKQNLWGHALFLASKMDPKTHASIMTRFANVSMKINDPLQTLYQLMSGRQPAAVTVSRMSLHGTLHTKAIIHQVTTMLATSENIYFQVISAC